MVGLHKNTERHFKDARRGLIVRFGKKEGQYPCKGSKSVFRGVKGLSEVRRPSGPIKSPREDPAPRGHRTRTKVC